MLCNGFHPIDQHLSWVFGFIVLYVSPSHWLGPSFAHLTAQKGVQEKADKTEGEESEMHPGFVRTIT